MPDGIVQLCQGGLGAQVVFTNLKPHALGTLPVSPSRPASVSNGETRPVALHASMCEAFASELRSISWRQGTSRFVSRYK